MFFLWEEEKGVHIGKGGETSFPTPCQNQKHLFRHIYKIIPKNNMSAYRHGGKGGKGKMIGGKSGKWMMSNRKAAKSVQRKPYTTLIAIAGIEQSTRSSRDYLRRKEKDDLEKIAKYAYQCALVAGRKTITSKDMMLAIKMADNSQNFVTRDTYKKSKPRNKH